MEKIIIRKEILRKGFAGSFILLTSGKKFSSVEKLIKDVGLKELMKKVFNEEIDTNNLSESSLHQQYTDILSMDKEENKCYKENEKFIELYKINDEFAIQIDFNIHLYHLVPKNDVYTKITPWYYADSKKYLGDTWGEQDKEIIDSIKSLPIIEFLKRYKGY